MTRPDDASGVERRFRGEAGRWDEIYSESGNPLARAWDRLTRSNVRRRFARTFERAGDLHGRSVLDLGCGSGRYLVEAALRGARRVVGVDFAPEMIETSRSVVASRSVAGVVELRCAKLETLELDGTFDLVIENGVFDYLDDTRAGLEQARRWMGGTYVATFPDRRAPRALPRSLYWRAHGFRIHLFDPDAITGLARDAGFQHFEIEKIGPIYLLAARVA
jgi:SAM-dependent methyltransferase